MSFFDEGDEPPTRVAQSRTRRAPSAARAGGGGHGVDPAIRQRRLIALAFGVLVLIILAFGVRTCTSNAAKDALRDYNRDVSAVIAESDTEVGRPLFQQLGESGQSPVERETQLNDLSNRASDQLSKAEGFSVPDEAQDAQRNLLLTLDLRQTGVRKIATQIRTALADSEDAEGAQAQIAAEMQQFLASDVVFDTRVRPYIKDALDEREVTGQTIADSQFLPDLTWLNPGTVSTRLGGGGGGSGDAAADDEDVAPGLHGHGLVSVGVGDTTLQPGEVVNRVAAGSGLAFNVSVANQGDNAEESVKVTVRLTGSGKPVTASRTIATTQPGTNADVAIPIPSPPLGQPVTATVTVAKVGGEEKTDNNKQSYTVFFER
ncbi:MAG TPA: hypothetical protein VN238_19250 [Solirubrobacteraceae bacterium]|nr:hypothetical protein [Solirubrobacteraceae bacterium]